MKINISSHINTFQIFHALRFAAYIVISVVLAKLGNNTTLIGNYEYLLMISGSTSFFWLGGYLTYYLSQNNNNNYRLAFNFILLFNFLSAFIIAIMYVTLKDVIFKHISFDTFICFLFYHLLNNQAYLNENYFLANQKNKALLHYSVINFILLFLGAFTGYRIFENINGILIGLAVASFVKCIPAIVWWFKNVNSVSSSDISLFTKQGGIISLSILLGSLGDYIDDYLVRIFFGSDQYAVYSIGAHEFPLLQILTTALSSVLIIHVSKNGIEKSLPEIKLQTNKLIKLLTPILCVMILLSNYAFPFFYNTSFAKSAYYFNLYALLSVSRFLFPQSIIIGLSHNRYLIISSIVECALHIIFSYILMQYIGIFGIVAGFLMAYLIDKLVLMYYVNKTTGYMPWDYTPIKSYLIANTAIIVAIVISLVL